MWLQQYSTGISQKFVKFQPDGDKQTTKLQKITEQILPLDNIICRNDAEGKSMTDMVTDIHRTQFCVLYACVDLSTVAQSTCLEIYGNLYPVL